MAKFSSSECEREAETKPLWYRTLWGAPIATFFIVTVLLLVGVHFTRPKWIKIEVANCYVAVLSVMFTCFFVLSLRVSSKVVKTVLGLFWLLMLPNTAYLFTDLAHFSYQWTHASSSSDRISLFIQYLLLELFAVTTFLFSFFPFEKIVKKSKATWLTLCNFLVGYGVVLGRYEHINSQVVFTHPLKVLTLAINILMSANLLEQVTLLGILCNVIYWVCRRLLLQRFVYPIARGYKAKNSCIDF
jgi:uncharacterized membrane protein